MIQDQSPVTNDGATVIRTGDAPLTRLVVNIGKRTNWVICEQEDAVNKLDQNRRWRSATAVSVVGGLFGGVLLVVAVCPPAATAATKPTKNASKIGVDVKAGGPYRIAAGGSVSLTANVSVSGQAKANSDLRTIGTALSAYEQANGSFPPAALTDASGKPLLSWRVLLLPYLGEDALYRQFDLTKAWDDPANKALLTKMPAVFRSSTARKGSTTTAYAGVGGPKQVFRSGAVSLGGGVKAVNVVDGADMTIAVGPGRVDRQVALERSG